MPFSNRDLLIFLAFAVAVMMWNDKSNFEFLEGDAAPKTAEPTPVMAAPMAAAKSDKVASTVPESEKVARDLTVTAPKDSSKPTIADINSGYLLGVDLNDPKYNNKDANKRTLAAQDLLPKEKNPDWFDNPNSEFNLSQAVAMEVPEYKFGIDTVGQSRKNASLDLRSPPPCPKFAVSPWNNSTIEPDYNIRPLC